MLVPAAASSIVFLFFALFIGTVISYISSRCNHVIPYTVAVFLFGIAISAIANTVPHPMNDSLIQGVDQWIAIDPNVLLAAFLPALLFGEAMHLNFYQVKEAFPSAALLAFPGAAFGAYMLGLCCFYALPQFINWNWRLCFIVGSILSATDPVSVIVTLKGLFSSSISTMRLTYLIVGEALLNDGMALVLFDALITPELSNPGDVTSYFVRVIFLSPLLGIALGLACVTVLHISNRRVSHEDKTVQVAITVSTAYISFFLAQYVVGVSGVISTVVSGVVIAWLGPSLILQPHSMETIWEFFEWIGNTLIFMIAGMIVGTYIMYYSVPEDYALVVVVYIYIFLIRFLLLAICYPLMSRMSPGYSFLDVCFSSFAGLRGAVSLALCIVLQKHVDTDTADESIHFGSISFPKYQIRQVVFIISGVVALTILINGTLSKAVFLFLYSKAGQKGSDADRVILHYVRKRIWQRTEDVLFRLQFSLPYHNQVVVRKLCKDILPDQDYSDDTIPDIHAHAHDFHRQEEEEEPYEKTATDRRAEEKWSTGVDDNREMVTEKQEKAVKMKHGIATQDAVKKSEQGFYRDGSEIRRAVGPVGVRARAGTGDHDRLLDAGSERGSKRGSERDNEREGRRVRRMVEQREILSELLDVGGGGGIGGGGRGTLGSASSESPWSLAGRDTSGKGTPIFVSALPSPPSSPSSFSSTRAPFGDDSDDLGKQRTRGGELFSPDTLPSLAVSVANYRGWKSEFSPRSRIANNTFNSVTRPISSSVDHFLITKFRILFLGVVRLNYMKQVRSGRLPRGSYAALVLFNSIDVGMATVHTDGLQDWDAINTSLSRLGRFESAATSVFPRLQGISAEDKVYILTSFVDAHRSAGDAILLHLGEQEGISTPEEALVVLESDTVVKEAEMRIADMDSEVLSLHVSKQASLMVLRSADDLIEVFVTEGILGSKAAHIFFDRTRAARKRLERVLRREFRALKELEGKQGEEGDGDGDGGQQGGGTGSEVRAVLYLHRLTVCRGA